MPLLPMSRPFVRKPYVHLGDGIVLDNDAPGRYARLTPEWGTAGILWKQRKHLSYARGGTTSLRLRTGLTLLLTVLTSVQLVRLRLLTGLVPLLLVLLLLLRLFHRKEAPRALALPNTKPTRAKPKAGSTRRARVCASFGRTCQAASREGGNSSRKPTR